MIRTYSELISLPTFEERLRYLCLFGKVGEETFGYDRWLNQNFYRTDREWLSIRNHIIVRDNGLDLGILPTSIIMENGKEIKQPLLIHHINPITKEDIINRSDFLLDPEYLITTIDSTHRVIHYGNDNATNAKSVERRMYDTCPWRK